MSYSTTCGFHHYVVVSIVLFIAIFVHCEFNYDLENATGTRFVNSGFLASSPSPVITEVDSRDNSSENRDYEGDLNNSTEASNTNNSSNDYTSTSTVPSVLELSRESQEIVVDEIPIPTMKEIALNTLMKVKMTIKLHLKILKFKNISKGFQYWTNYN